MIAVEHGAGVERGMDNGYNIRDNNGHARTDQYARGLLWLVGRAERNCAADHNRGGSCERFNLGTGHGYSVHEVIRAFERANGVKVPYEIAPRRAGNMAERYADATKAERVLGWKAERGIEEMCRDAWKWEMSQKEE